MGLHFYVKVVLCMLLKTLAEFGATQERETRIVLDLIGCGDLPSRHALLNHGRRQVGTRAPRTSIACGR